jgi:NADP-dependent 3-hydroxy acid dehydrogenase YdfG
MGDALKGRVAIITGAAHGMGEAIAKTFAREGATLGLMDKQGDALDKVVQDVRALGANALGQVADVRKAAEVNAAVQAIEAKLGPTDTLVCSAGLGIYKAFEALTEEDWDTTFDVNVKGTFLSCKAVIPGMVQRQKGLVITIASIAAVMRGFNSGSCYGPSKYAVRGFSRYLDVELRSKGVVVCCLNPGSTDSHFRGQPTGNPNFMVPDDIAKAALYAATQRDQVAAWEISFSMINEGW